jgi:large subunit ribosomal protein L7/L12
MAAKKATEEKKKEKADKKDVSKNVEKLVDEISKLSVIELSELVNSLQDKLGVSAMPMAAAPAAAGPNGADAGTEEGAGGAEQTVVMTGVGDSKIQVIKALRTIDQSLGLKEAKDMTENLPAEVLKDAKAEDAKDAADKLKEAGATVELK